MVTVVGGTLPTLIEQAKISGQFGNVLPVVDTISKATPVVNNAYWEQSNLPQGQLTVRVVGKPDATVRRVNQAVDPSKATFTQTTESVCEFANLSKIDDAVLRGFPNKMAARSRLIMKHPESLAERLETAILYAASADGLGEFDGIMTRPEYSALGDQTLSAGGTGGGSVYASILLVYWGTDTVKIIYPQGTMAGVNHDDFGLVMTETETGAAGAELPMWKDWFSVQAGLSVVDPRYIVRLSDIITADVLGVSGTQQITDYTTNLVYRTAQMLSRIPIAKKGRPRWIMPRSIAEGLTMQLMATTNANVFSRSQIDGSPVTMLHGIPVDVSDLMTYTEAEVT